MPSLHQGGASSGVGHAHGGHAHGHAHGGAHGSSKSKNPNLLQVPEIEGPRPKSVPNSPSIPRAFTTLRNHLTTAWGGHSSKKKEQSGVQGKENTHIMPHPVFIQF